MKERIDRQSRAKKYADRQTEGHKQTHSWTERGGEEEIEWTNSCLCQ